MDGTFSRYEYERSFNRRTKETDERGIVTTYEYDTQGNLTRKKEGLTTPQERVTTYTYDGNGNLLTTTVAADANTAQAQTTMTYDTNGNVATITDAEGNETAFTYDTMGNVLTKRDGRNKTWRYTYNNTGKLLTATDPENRTTTYTYDGSGNRIKETDPLTKEKTFTYDGRNRLLTMTDALGNTSRMAYNGDGKLIRQTDGEGKQVNYTYDTEGRLTETEDGNGNAITQIYAEAGGGCSSCSGGTELPVATMYPTFTKEYGYDKRNRKLQERDIATETGTLTTSFTYDHAGNLITRTDKEGKTTTYEYDALNRLKKVTDPLNQTTAYTYDNRDNLISLKDAKNQITTFTYDKNNRLTKETRPMGQETTYQYDGNGNLIRKTDPKGQRIEYGYDDANRMTEIRHYNSTSSLVKTIALTYDHAGNLKTYNDGTTNASYTYDDAYRKTGETINFGAFSKTIQYGYNRNGTKKSFTYPDGTEIGYTYDNNNQPQGMNLPGAGYLTYNGYEWTRPTGMTLPGGSTRSFTYDPLMRTKTIQAKDPGQNPIQQYSYTYDKMDNITAKNTEAGNYAYGYDGLYRLDDVQKDTVQTEVYTYDQVGNRITAKNTTGNWSYNSNNELQSHDGTTYQYDDNGNTTRKTSGGNIQNYIYDVDNRLIEVRDGSNTLIAAYTYDPFGRRIKKTVGATTTVYLYADEGLIGEYDGTGTELKTYGYKPDSTWSTDPIFMKESGQVYFYQNDHLRTPQKLTNISGAVVWSASYDAFGKATVDGGSTVVNNLRFPGQYYDTETGLHYNYHRFYDPNTGRYVSEDPIGLLGGLNYYLYVDSNPSSLYDDIGLSGKRDRGRTARPDGTADPTKHTKPHPTKPDKIIYTDPDTGKSTEKAKPEGYDEEWARKHPKKDNKNNQEQQCEPPEQKPVYDPPRVKVPPPPIWTLSIWLLIGIMTGAFS